MLACGAESYSRVALGCFNRMGAVDPLPAGRSRPTGPAPSSARAPRRSCWSGPARPPPGAPCPWPGSAGTGFSCDADHPTAPSPGGEQAERALRAALDDAGVAPGQVGAVVPHGTGTEHNDEVECRVMGRVFGRPAAELPLYSLKALIGHTGGAAGALAAVAAVELLRRKEIPANVDVGPLDPALPVRVGTAPAALEQPVVLVNAYAFGGNNASLVFAGAS